MCAETNATNRIKWLRTFMCHDLRIIPTLLAGTGWYRTLMKPPSFDTQTCNCNCIFFAHFGNYFTHRTKNDFKVVLISIEQFLNDIQQINKQFIRSETPIQNTIFSWNKKFPDKCSDLEPIDTELSNLID